MNIIFRQHHAHPLKHTSWAYRLPGRFNPCKFPSHDN